MEEIVRGCEACQKTQPGKAVKIRKLPSPEPTDILRLHHFEWKKTSFLIMVDLGSRYCEAHGVQNLTSGQIKDQLISWCARIGHRNLF